MNTFDPLSLLKSLLATGAPSQTVELRRSAAIDQVLTQLQAEAKAGEQIHVPKDLQIEAVQRFWRSEQLTSLRDARLVSFGLGLDAGEDGCCVLEDAAIFHTALDEINQWRDIPRQFRKCYQGLVRSYFEYDGMAPSTDAIGQKNWILLRTYLQQNISCIRDDKSINPDWVDCTLENPNLFTEQPGKAYGQELLQDKSERIDTIRKLMGIADASWFTRALIIGQVEISTQQSDITFQNLVSLLLQRIENNHVVRDEGLRLILERYVSIAQTPLHVNLKDCAAHWWGNPWLSSNRSQWGGVSEGARNMVAHWLKKEFINLFFTKLAEDGLSDKRRVKFWEKYVNSVDEMYFALGSRAMQSREQDFIEIRKKLNGLIVYLDGSGSSNNNAFIMGIGELIAVEFSGKSNAFYGYSQKHSVPFDLSKPVLSGPVDGLNSLKRSTRILHLTHKNNHLGYLKWEDRFENALQKEFNITPYGDRNNSTKTKNIPTADSTAELKKLIRSQSANSTPETLSLFDKINTPILPTTTSSSTPQITDENSSTLDLPNNKFDSDELTEIPPANFAIYTTFSNERLKILIRKIGGSIKDNTAKGGALWIYSKKSNVEVGNTLKQWGFTYLDGKGWWKK